MIDTTELIGQARAARGRAVAPYSNYAVGAALLTGSGRIFQGCNIESGAFGTTICAERVAIFSAIAAGERSFKALAVVSKDGATPCGACRQVIHEQCGEIPIYIQGTDEHTHRELSISELLPFPFGFKKS